jgi:hypothetical protein
MIFAADIVYSSKKGDITFSHMNHIDIFSCEKCHNINNIRIEVNKKTAHNEACKDCHQIISGPTKCKGCHIK